MIFCINCLRDKFLFIDGLALTSLPMQMVFQLRKMIF